MSEKNGPPETEEPMLPLDERFRQAEQYQLDLEDREQVRPPQRPFVCIGHCAICPRCRS